MYPNRQVDGFRENFIEKVFVSLAPRRESLNKLHQVLYLEEMATTAGL